MNSVSSAANVYLWISIKSGGCYLKKWNTGGLGVALLRSFLGVLAVVVVLAVYFVRLRSAVKVWFQTSLKVSAAVLYS